MNNIGEYIKEHSSIQTVESFTLQDDAPKTIRDENLRRIKAFMNASKEDGKRILMVSNLMSGKGIQRRSKRISKASIIPLTQRFVDTSLLYRLDKGIGCQPY